VDSRLRGNERSDNACPSFVASSEAMPKITYIEHDGTVHKVEAELDSTVMERPCATTSPSIVAECGGGCSCATCMVYVDDAWTAVVGPPSPRKRNSSTALRSEADLAAVLARSR